MKNFHKAILFAAILNSSVMYSQGIYKYEPFSIGAIQASGWLREQMTDDLNKGYLSCFDKICPFNDLDAFNTNQTLSSDRFPDYPHLKTWWSSEAESTLKDGITRMAILSRHEYFLSKASRWMERLLEFQGKDGYIGIYKKGNMKNSRYNHQTADDGELWVQSRAFSAVLSWYEYTKDSRFLKAIEEATDLSISQYTDRNYFKRNFSEGGVEHAVSFMDILERLYRITGKKKYLEFAEKFYHDYNECPGSNRDATVANLLDPKKRFAGHTPHVAEGLYMAQFIANISHDPQITEAASKTMGKTAYHLTPGGAMVGDESVWGRQGTADMHREYCAMPDLIYSLNRIVTFTGNMKAADMVERVTYNAAQAGRLPDLKGLEYLSRDNRIVINSCDYAGRLAYDANRFNTPNGVFNPKDFEQEATCCVCSAGRLLPYFMEGIWMKNSDGSGIAAMQYASCTLNFNKEGTDIKIDEQTNYPFSDEVTFKMNMSKSKKFNITLRIPSGAKDINIEKMRGLDIQKEDGYVVLNKKWKDGDEIRVHFDFAVEMVPQPASQSVKNNGFFVKRGPLVYSLAFPYKLHETFEYNNTNFYRYDVETLDKTGWDYSIEKDANFILKKDESANQLKPWFKSPIYLEGELVDKAGNKQNVKLVPEGCTVLRRVTFPEYKK